MPAAPILGALELAGPDAAAIPPGKRLLARIGAAIDGMAVPDEIGADILPGHPASDEQPAGPSNGASIDDEDEDGDEPDDSDAIADDGEPGQQEG